MSQPTALGAAAAILTPTEVGARQSVAVFSAAAAKDYTIEANADGTGLVKRYKIFKAGTFSDSRGERRTWTAEHLALMVANFNLLRNTGTFPNVPVRADHRTSVLGIAGYFAGLSSDEHWLYQDIEFTEPEMFGKFQRGTFRGRSLEVGFYEDNDEALYWPVVLGSAFVDIPAVEGLYGKSHILMSNDKETAPVETTKFRVNGADVTDAGAVQAHITQLEATVAAGKAPAVAKFRVNGAEVADPEAVQTHISTLEAFAAESRDSGRKAFIAQLVTDGKLGAPQAEAFTNMVVGTADLPGMSDAQYAAFQASYKDAPKLGIFERHGDVSNPGGEVTPAANQLAIDEGVMAQFRLSGMSEDAIKATPTYKRLQAAQAGK